MKLLGLSRRSRYLVNESNKATASPCITHEIHLAKAIRHLDKIMKYFADKYSQSFTKIPIKCADINASESLNFFVKTS